MVRVAMEVVMAMAVVVEDREKVEEEEVDGQANLLVHRGAKKEVVVLGVERVGVEVVEKVVEMVEEKGVVAMAEDVVVD